MIVERRSLAKKVAIGVVVFLLVLVALFLLRGWIRETLIKQYANATYGKSLIELSERELLPLNQELAPSGLSFKSTTSPFGNDPCSLAYYIDFHETIQCTTFYQTNSSLKFDAQDMAQWNANAPGHEVWLKQHGWSVDKTYSDQTSAKSLVELSKPHEGYGSNYIQYGKIQDATSCKLFISLSADVLQKDDVYVAAIDSCRRDVKFFGGSQELHSDSLGPSL